MYLRISREVTGSVVSRSSNFSKKDSKVFMSILIIIFREMSSLLDMYEQGWKQLILPEKMYYGLEDLGPAITQRVNGDLIQRSEFFVLNQRK